MTTQTPETKICRKCKDPKSVDEFPWKSKVKGIRHSTCKLCQRQYNETYYSTNQAELALKSKLYQKAIREKAAN